MKFILTRQHKKSYEGMLCGTIHALKRSTTKLCSIVEQKVFTLSFFPLTFSVILIHASMSDLLSLISTLTKSATNQENACKILLSFLVSGFPGMVEQFLRWKET